MSRIVALFRRLKRTRGAFLVLLLALVSCWEVEADLAVSTSAIDFGPSKESTVITVRNDSEDKALTSGVVTLEYKFKPDRPWLTVSPISGRAGEAEKISHTVTVDRDLMVFGENLATISVTSNGGSQIIQVKAVRPVPGCSTPPTPPGSPSPPNGASSVSTSASLSWENGDSQCEQLTATYDVYFGLSSPPPLHHNNDSLKQWTPTSLAKSTTYYWRIVSRDANGSTSSPEWSFRTDCDDGPGAINLIAPANGATNLSVNQALSWGGGNSQCPGLVRTYDVYFGTSSPPPLASNTDTKSWAPPSLSKGTTYYWRIVAKDQNGSVSSEERSFTTEEAVCTAKVTAVTLTSPANNATNVPLTTDLTWSGGDSQCPGLTATYDVYFGTVNPPPFSHNNGSAKSWDAPLANNNVYFWYIVAKDANGSITSSARTFRTPCSLAPTAPSLTYPADGATGVSINDNLTWSSGNSQCAGLTVTYEVYFGLTSPPPLADGDVSGTKAFDPGLMLPATRYYWRIVAKDANGSTSSAERTFTTGIIPCTSGPGSVALVSPADGATSQPLDTDLTWSGGNSTCEGQTATYDVYFGTTSPPPLHHNNGEEKTWDPGALSPTTRYYWRIVAKDGNGTSSSSERDFTTGQAPCVSPPSSATISSPANGASDVSIDANLVWTGGNSQCGGLTATYDVYFGTTNPPALDHNNGSTKNWDPGALAYATTYYWRIVAKDANGSASASVWSFTTEDAPCVAPPTSAIISSPANGASNVSISANLSWTGGNSQCAGLTATYDVYFGTANPPALDHNNGSTKNWDPGALQYGTTYYWRIVAKDANGSASASVWSFTTEDAPCVAPPTSATVSSPANGATGVSINAVLSWTAGNSQCAGLTATYDVYFGTTNTPALDHNNGSTKNWDPGTLEYSTTYYWKIVAKDANGSAPATVWSFTTAACELPPTVATISAPNNGATGVAIDANLSWSGGNSQCAGLTATYDVYFGTTNPPPLDHNNGSTKNWDPGVLQHNTTYYWRIATTDDNGTATGPVWSFTTEPAGCVLPPTTAAITSPANGGSDVSINVNIVWTGGTSQCPGLTATYDVHFGTSNPPPFNHSNGTVKSFDPGTLLYATTYYWQIVAKDANGQTAGPVWSFTTEPPCLDPPSAACTPSPANNATNRNENSNLAWQCGTSACGLAVTYDVYLGTTETLGEEQKVGTTATKSLDLPRLRSSTKYYWKVVTKDANGSTSSPVWNFTTRN